MVKKILPFLCSLAPFYAFGAEVIIDTNPDEINLGAGDYANISSTDNINVNVGTGGISVGNLSVLTTAQAPADTDGDLYIVNTASVPFGIVSNGAVEIRDDVRVDSATNGLQLSGPVAMNIDGDIFADSYFRVFDAISFTSGAISSSDYLSISAGQITTGIIGSAGGDTTVAATGALNIGGITASMAPGATDAPVTTISGATITTGYAQNLYGEMTITAGGDFSAVLDSGNPSVMTGSVENSGDKLTITVGGNMTVDGTLKNDLSSGTLKITANSLTVSGSDAVNNSSFVNAGDAIFNIAGAMSFEHGMNLTNMAATSGMQITAGTLDLGTNNIIANTKASLLNIDVNNGVLSAGAIVNGDENGAATNSSTQTLLKGVGVNATSVRNYGNKLSINTYDTSTDNNITISQGVIGSANATTNITAADALSISGDIENAGTMNLSGSNITLASATNTGDALNILAPTNNGVVRIGGVVSNSNGTTTITSKDLSLGGVSNSGGTLEIVASDTNGGALSVGSITVSGGSMNMNAWLGNIESDALNITSGVLNFGSAVHDVAVNGAVSVAGNIKLADAVTTGNGDLYLTSGDTTIDSSANITVGGNIIATGANAGTATFDGVKIFVNGDSGVNVQNAGNVITFGATNSVSELQVANAISATNGGKVVIYSGTSSAKSLTESSGGALVMYGNEFTATTGDVDIADGVWFGGTTSVPSVGMIINDSLDEFELASTSGNVSIASGIIVGADNVLDITAGDSVAISGATTNNGKIAVNAANNATFSGAITTGGTLSPAFSVVAKTININGMTNSGVASLAATGSSSLIQLTAAISNTGTFTAVSDNNIIFADFETTSGVVDIEANTGTVTTNDFYVSGESASVAVNANQVNMGALRLTDGVTTITSSDINAGGNVAVSGNIVQGGSNTDVGMLKLAGVSTFDANSLSITNGGMIVKSGNTTYTIVGPANLGSEITVASNAKATISADTIDGGDLTNAGELKLLTTDSVLGLGLGNIINNSALTIESNGKINATSFANNTAGTAILGGTGLSMTGILNNQSGVLYQGFSGDLVAGDTNITSANYEITASSVIVDGISQYGNSVMLINTSDLSVDGNIWATDLTIKAQKDTGGQTIWSNIDVSGNVSGNVKIYGLEHMSISGNYTYNDNSLLHVAVLPYADSIAMNSTIYNYWADVSLAEDNTLGRITNRGDDPKTSALIYVDGRFASDLSTAGDVLTGSPLVSPEIGVNLYDIVDPGTAIWLVYAKKGVSDLETKIRNLNLNFCNADGSICFNYFDAYSATATDLEDEYTGNDLPIYLSVRDYNDDGLNDSLYIVFDPRFGGPVKVFSIEPIVGRVDDRTDGEINAAGALDNMIAGQLYNKGFYNNTPIEAIPLSFAGTNVSELATELYNRMERYVVERDGTALARFSRLVQPRELEQVAGSIALNEHTSNRDFEDHMFDEFIWNRNRNLSKAWFDADFGMFRQNVSDKKKVDGNRFNITAGFDWQNSKRSIFGLMARISHMSSDNSDDMDLSYMPGQKIDGHNSMTVADTDFGIGGYWLYTLGTKARFYGNAMLDLHMLDLSRDQNYVAHIDGSGHAFSLISEMGLLHDWLNQYIVGNLYTRVGYNFGFSIKEKVGGSEYMRMMSDGYFILTPGYSLIAQKRIYASPWFQIRPYASIGIEYDVVGMPDVTKYRFASANSYSEYDVDIDPLWANIGGGIEMLSATGVQVGLDYRYQYNNDIQLHNIRLSGSIRF